MRTLGGGEIGVRQGNDRQGPSHVLRHKGGEARGRGTEGTRSRREKRRRRRDEGQREPKMRGEALQAGCGSETPVTSQGCLKKPLDTWEAQGQM
jgi:hypothetical protein